MGAIRKWLMVVWLGTASAQAGYWRADFNLDGVVDSNDLALLQANMGRRSMVPNPEVILTNVLIVTPDRKTVLQGEVTVDLTQHELEGFGQIVCWFRADFGDWQQRLTQVLVVRGHPTIKQLAYSIDDLFPVGRRIIRRVRLELLRFVFNLRKQSRPLAHGALAFTHAVSQRRDAR